MIRVPAALPSRCGATDARPAAGRMSYREASRSGDYMSGRGVALWRRQPRTRRAVARSGRPARQRLRLVARRGWLLLVLLLLVLGCVGATFWGADVTSTGANLGVVFTAGNLQHTNNRANRAILTATRLVPGGTATGTVTIRNTGDIGGDFSLSSSDIVDTPGSNGGRLSGVLTLAIDGTTAPAYTVYNGPLTAMPTPALGTWDLTSSLATAGFADIFSQETDPDRVGEPYAHGEDAGDAAARRHPGACQADPRGRRTCSIARGCWCRCATMPPRGPATRSRSPSGCTSAPDRDQTEPRRGE